MKPSSAVIRTVDVKNRPIVSWGPSSGFVEGARPRFAGVVTLGDESP